MADASLLKSTNGNVLYMQGGNTTIVKSEDNTVDIETTSSGSITTFDLSIADSISDKIDEAPKDGKAYARKDGEWTVAQSTLTSEQETIDIEAGDESTNIEATKYYIDGDEKKEVQEKMVAGDNIDIAEDGKTISVTGKKTLNVQSPITFDKDTATIGFDDSDYAKKTDIPTDFYTKEETDTAISNAVADKVTTTQLQTEVGTLETSIGNVQSNVDSVSSNLDTNYYTKTQVDGFLKNWSGFVVVGEGEDLPDPSEAELGKIYLKKEGTGKTDNYTEWICDGTAWSQIGEMSIDLSNYYTKKEIEDNYATLGDLTTTTTNLESEIDDKLSTVAVDGSTITGDGTASNPLKATTDMSSAYTLVQGTYVKLVDDTENKQTKIDDSLIGTMAQTVNSLGNQVSGLTGGLSSLEATVDTKQDKINAIVSGTTYTTNAVTLIETASNKIEGVEYNYYPEGSETLSYGKLYTVPDYSGAATNAVLTVNSNKHLEWTDTSKTMTQQIATTLSSSTEPRLVTVGGLAPGTNERYALWASSDGETFSQQYLGGTLQGYFTFLAWPNYSYQVRLAGYTSPVENVVWTYISIA